METPRRKLPATNPAGQVTRGCKPGCGAFPSSVWWIGYILDSSGGHGMKRLVRAMYSR
jgi:hypothetical protein